MTLNILLSIFFVYVLLSIASLLVIFYKTCGLGLNPPYPFGLSFYKFYLFLKEKSLEDEYKVLKRYVATCEAMHYLGAVLFFALAVYVGINWKYANNNS